MLQLRAASPQNITQLRLCFPVVFGFLAWWFVTSQEIYRCCWCSAPKVLESSARNNRGSMWGVHTDICSSPFHARRSRAMWCGRRGTKICCTQIFQPLLSSCLSISFVVGGMTGKPIYRYFSQTSIKTGRQKYRTNEKKPNWLNVQSSAAIRNKKSLPVITLI